MSSMTDLLLYDENQFNYSRYTHISARQHIPHIPESR